MKADAVVPLSFASFSFGAKVSFIDTHSNALYFKKTEDGKQVFDTNLSNEFDYKENTQMFYASLAGEKSKWKYQGGVRFEITQTNGYSYTLNRRTTFRYFRAFPSIAVNYDAGKEQTVGFTLNR